MFPDTAKIARRIVQAAGGENSIFKDTNMYPKAGEKHGSDIVVELAKSDFDRDKAKEILTKIVSSLIRKINMNSGKNYAFEIKDFGDYWSVSFT